MDLVKVYDEATWMNEEILDDAANYYIPTWTGPDGARTWVIWTPATNEIIRVGAANPSSQAWEIEYIWKDRTDTYTLTAGMAPLTIDIPIGQRKHLRFDGSLCKSPDLDGFTVRRVP